MVLCACPRIESHYINIVHTSYVLPEDVDYHRSRFGGSKAILDASIAFVSDDGHEGTLARARRSAHGAISRFDAAGLLLPMGLNDNALHCIWLGSATATPGYRCL